MENNELLPVEDCCSYYNIEYHFLESLQEHGLIEIINIEQQHYVNMNNLNDLEKLMRLHFDLDINLEGIEALNSLLERIKTMQQEIMNLRNRLKNYENEFM